MDTGTRRRPMGVPPTMRSKKQRRESVQKELVRTRTGLDKLLEAYQEGLLELEELRQRMPDLRKREKALKSDLANLDMAATERQTFLRLAYNLEDFLSRLRSKADTQTHLLQFPSIQKTKMLRI